MRWPLFARSVAIRQAMRAKLEAGALDDWAETAAWRLRRLLADPTLPPDLAAQVRQELEAIQRRR